MDLERTKFMGHLAEKELESKDLMLKISGLRDAIRDCLDPFEALEDLKLDTAAQLAVQAADLQIAYREAIREIAAIRKTLGR